jgi:hypothetical protein
LQYLGYHGGITIPDSMSLNYAMTVAGEQTHELHYAYLS